jgi:hypothetical protein
MLRLPHFLDNRFKDGGEVVSFRRYPPFTPRKIHGSNLEFEMLTKRKRKKNSMV